MVIDVVNIAKNTIKLYMKEISESIKFCKLPFLRRSSGYLFCTNFSHTILQAN